MFAEKNIFMSRDPVSRARLVCEAGLGSEAVGGLEAKILWLRRRHGHADLAGTFPEADRGLAQSRR